MVAVIEIREATALTPAEYAQLSDLIVAVVDDGASIGYLPPMDRALADAYWQTVLAPNRVLLVAEEDGRIVGSAQLHLETRPNGDHRAEVAKVMVHPDVRRRGLGRAIARRNARTLLVLDTREGDPSNVLYQGLGFQEAGRIPNYCKSEHGGFDATVVYYKQLS
jgi:ribosomal protein S18 acetylase RimI-like enzyme